MSRQNAASQYERAVKAGQKYYHASVARGEYPYTKVLDDVFSELDSSRQSRLLTAIADTQVVITATDPATVGKIFHVKNGMVKA